MKHLALLLALLAAPADAQTVLAEHQDEVTVAGTVEQVVATGFSTVTLAPGSLVTGDVSVLGAARLVIRGGTVWGVVAVSQQGYVEFAGVTSVRRFNRPWPMSVPLTAWSCFYCELHVSFTDGARWDGAVEVGGYGYQLVEFEP